MKYEVLGIEPKQYEKEVAGGDSCSLKTYDNKKAAFKKAISESKKNIWWEVEVRCVDIDGELNGYWYFKHGQIICDIL